MTYHNDQISPFSTFLNEDDERYAILIGVMVALTGTKAEEMILPGIDQEDIRRIVTNEYPYLLGGYYATKVLKWVKPGASLLRDGIHADDVHAFVYGIDCAMTGQSPEKYSAALSEEGLKDISSSPIYYRYGYSAGKIIRWIV